MKTTVLTINQTKEEKKVEIPIDGKSKTNVEFLWERFMITVLIKGLELWCLTPLSTVFQLCCGGQFYWRRKLESP